MVDVLHEGSWYPGELRSWDQSDDGSWSGMAGGRGVGVDLPKASAVDPPSPPPRGVPAFVKQTQAGRLQTGASL